METVRNPYKLQNINVARMVGVYFEFCTNLTKTKTKRRKHFGRDSKLNKVGSHTTN